MKLFIKIFIAMIITALMPQVANCYDFEEKGMFFNLNEDGKTVTFTYKTPIMFALDAPAPTEKGYMGNIAVPSKVTHNGKTYTVTAVSDYAFSGNSELKSVIIPASVKTIGQGAFTQCYSLNSVALPPALTEISDYMFAESSLTDIIIPGKVKRIGASAFNNCHLKSVAIPNSVTEIGKAAFSANRWMETATLGKGVKVIGEAAFSICSKLGSINLPSSLTEIGAQAFNECVALTSVNIPAKVSNIGTGAFCNCHELTALTVDPNNKTYDSRDHCNAIIETASNKLVVGCEASRIPATVTTIGSEAFRGCYGLKSADIPAAVTVIEDHAYFYCKSIKDLSLPNSVTTIGSYAFVGCDSLETVIIPNSVTTISDHAFLHDDHIKNVMIGSGVTSIGTWAFKGLDEVKAIICKIQDVSQVKMGKDVFDEIDLSSCILAVPAGTAQHYKTASQWKDFKNIKEYSGTLQY